MSVCIKVLSPVIGIWKALKNVVTGLIVMDNFSRAKLQKFIMPTFLDV